MLRCHCVLYIQRVQLINCAVYLDALRFVKVKYVGPSCLKQVMHPD